MRISASLLLTSFFLSAGLPLRAQSLADVAKQEEDRRKEVKASSKTYTNKDLKTLPPGPAPQPNASNSTDAPATDTTPVQADSQAAVGQDKAISEIKDKAYWSRRMQELGDTLDRDRTLADALQTRINSLTTDFVNRDDSAQRAKIATDRDKALAELDRMKKAVVQDEKAVAAFEEEARRAGVPPGWLR